MLKQASVSDLLNDRVSRDRQTYVVVTMRRYPRFLNRQYRDEYVAEMSPDWELFEDWLSAKRDFNDHNGAFRRSGFERRFTISESGLEHLARLCALAEEKDVYFVCQCGQGERCHRELVLMIARKLFRVKVGKLFQEYPVFARRLAGSAADVRKRIVRVEDHAKTKARRRSKVASQ